MLPTLLLLLVGFALATLAGAAATAWRITHPPRRTYATALAAGKPGDPGELDRPRPFDTTRFATPRGEVAAWLIEGDAPCGPVVLFAHGWASSRLSVLPRIDAFAPHARRICAVDLPGLGESNGWCALGAREGEVLAAVTRELLVAPAELVLAGSSMGATASLAAAAEIESREGTPVAGVILEGVYRDPWTPLRRTLQREGKPWRIIGRLALAAVNAATGGRLARERFDRASIARGVSAPILFLHGDADAIAPIDHARAIADATAQARFTTIPGAAHHELWTDDNAPASAGAIVAFLSCAPSAAPDQGETAETEQRGGTGRRHQQERAPT